MQRKIKVLFSSHDFKFLNHVVSRYKQDPGYEVLLEEHEGHVIQDTEECKKLLEVVDIIFCEWCLGNAEWYSQNKKRHQVLIIRLHHQEVNLPFLDRIEWGNVDKILFICPNNKKLFLKKFPYLNEKTLLLYNLIDCASFRIPKLYGAEFNLGFIGSAPMRKAPHIAVDILNRLKQSDSRDTLYFKGKQPFEYDWLWRRPEERRYYEKLYEEINTSSYADSIIFDPHGNDVQEWFSKIGFLLSTSDHEGSHQAVAEGMASGAIPVIRNWDGADQLYPAKYVFRDIEEAVELILKWKTRNIYDHECNEAERYAQENFDYHEILKIYDTLISNLLGRKKSTGYLKESIVEDS